MMQGGRAACAALRAALARLPDDQRTAVECQLAGWSGQQTADAPPPDLDPAVAAVARMLDQGSAMAAGRHTRT